MSKRRGLPETSRMRHDPHFVDQLFSGEEISVGRRIAINVIEANPDQPRSMLGDLSDLKASIEAKGVLEPILVRPREGGRFTIISGERRFRAAMEAGLSDIPCIVLDVSDAEVLEIALIENLQRKDLSPLEEADGYLTLQERHDYTHEQIATSRGEVPGHDHGNALARPASASRQGRMSARRHSLEVLPARGGTPARRARDAGRYRGVRKRRWCRKRRRKDGPSRSGVSRTRPLPKLPEGLRTELPAARRRVRREPRFSRQRLRTEARFSRPSEACFGRSIPGS